MLRLTKAREASITPGVIPAKAGIQCLVDAQTLGPRLRVDDDFTP